MATLPITEQALIETYGPHLNQAPPGGWHRDVEDVDHLTRTHCCFCGQQCSLYLKVKDNQVVGFEPDYDFPFNEGKLCPKGVKRYLQGSHPDRLLEPMQRDPAAPGGFRPVSWDHALSRTAAEIRRIQAGRKVVDAAPRSAMHGAEDFVDDAQEVIEPSRLSDSAYWK